MYARGSYPGHSIVKTFPLFYTRHSSFQCEPETVGNCIICLFFLPGMLDSIPMAFLRHDRIDFGNVYHIISLWWNYHGCLFPHLSAAQHWIMTNNLISAAQSLFTDCVFCLFILFYTGLDSFPWLFSFFSSSAFPFLCRASLLTIRSRVSPPRHPVCVCVCVSVPTTSGCFGLSSCVAGCGPECDSLSQSHGGRKQSLFGGSFLLIYSWGCGICRLTR